VAAVQSDPALAAGRRRELHGHYTPTDTDVPLRGWLKEHSSDEAK
jgi:hypothetical protein